jgi:hypothetical protein
VHVYRLVSKHTVEEGIQKRHHGHPSIQRDAYPTPGNAESHLTHCYVALSTVQDRCHRIGQSRDVHIYRLVSQHTMEESILRKCNQKRHLDRVASSSHRHLIL